MDSEQAFLEALHATPADATGGCAGASPCASRSCAATRFDARR